MLHTIEFDPNQRVQTIFKKVTGNILVKFSGSLLELVRTSLTSKYEEEYLKTRTITDLEKVDNKLKAEVKELLKCHDTSPFTKRDTYPGSPLRNPEPYTIPPYTIPPIIDPYVKPRGNGIICTYSLSEDN